MSWDSRAFLKLKFLPLIIVFDHKSTKHDLRRKVISNKHTLYHSGFYRRFYGGLMVLQFITWIRVILQVLLIISCYQTHSVTLSMLFEKKACWERNRSSVSGCSFICMLNGKEGFAHLVFRSQKYERAVHRSSEVFSFHHWFCLKGVAFHFKPDRKLTESSGMGYLVQPLFKHLVSKELTST